MLHAWFRACVRVCAGEVGTLGTLATKSTQQLEQFLASPRVASLLSAEAIEELYQQRQPQAASPLAGTQEYYEEEYLIEVGLD